VRIEGAKAPKIFCLLFLELESLIPILNKFGGKHERGVQEGAYRRQGQRHLQQAVRVLLFIAVDGRNICAPLQHGVTLL
jgi:hypothetical protein